MDDYIGNACESIPITTQEIIDAEHPWMPTDRVASAFRISIEHNIPVTELMFGQSNTQWYHR